MSDANEIQGSNAYLFLVPAGLCLGFGLVMLYYSYGWSVGPLNQNIGQAGFTGLDNLGPTGSIGLSIGSIVLGLAIMVGFNANAWKHTDGY